MHKSVRLVLAVALASFLPAALAAQNPWVWVGAGGTFPFGDYGDYANTGALGVAGVGFPVGDAGLSVLGEGFFGQNSHSDVTGDKTNPYGLMGGLQYTPAGPDATQGIYVYGQAGILFHKYGSDSSAGETNSGFGFAAGGGYFFPLGSMSGWLDARVMSASETKFFGILFGVSFPLGGDGM